MGIRYRVLRALLPVAEKIVSKFKGGEIIEIDYRPSPRVRYGYTHQMFSGLHELLASQQASYLATLGNFNEHKDMLAMIPATDNGDGRTPYWNNGWFMGTDPISLCCFIADKRPGMIIEVGSGNTTKFARWAIERNNLGTQIVSIDPQPRAEIDGLADKIVRMPLENTDLAVFQQLNRSDIMIFDGSHRCFQNSDVTVFFLEVLPALRSGVLVYIDDIYLPYDYPADWLSRWYSEQYVLASTLIADAGRRYRIVLPMQYLSKDADARRQLQPIFEQVPASAGFGNGFWLEVL